MAEKANTSAATATTTSISKKEAVRRALAELGTDAPLARLQAQIKSKFGFDLSTNHISSAKSDILREPASPAKPVAAPAPVGATPSAPAATPAPRPAAPARTNGVSRLQKKSGAKGKARPAPVAKPVSQKAAPAKTSAPGIGLGDIEAVKRLVARIGAKQLRGLIDLLAR
jgi:hypothetical protein